MKRLITSLIIMVQLATATHPALASGRENLKALDKQRLAVLTLINAERIQAGAGPVVLDTKLNGIAQNYVTSLAIRGVVEHGDLKGRMSAQKQLNPWELCGEILGRVGETPTDPKYIVLGWIESPRHKQVMLNDTYTACGIGIVHTKSETYYAAEFIKYKD